MRKRLLLAALVVCAATIVPTATVEGQSDDNGLFSMTVDGSCDGFGCSVGSFLASLDAPNPGDWIRDYRDQEPDVADQATDLRTFVNERNDSFVTHTNEVLDHYGASVSNATYVLELTIQNDESDGTDEATLYAVAEADGENVTSLELVESTNATVDRTHTLPWNKAEDLDEDVRAYHADYVDPGEVPPESYVVRMASKYDVSEIEVNDT